MTLNRHQFNVDSLLSTFWDDSDICSVLHVIVVCPFYVFFFFHKTLIIHICCGFFAFPESGFIRVREMSGKFKIFQGQGIVREFHNLSGKIEFLLKCQGNVREF